MIGDVMALAISSDDVLLASISKSATRDKAILSIQEYALHIHDMATGTLLHTYHAEGWATSGRSSGYCRECITFTLRWASSSLRLCVGCRQFTMKEAELETLLVFDFK